MENEEKNTLDVNNEAEKEETAEETEAVAEETPVTEEEPAEKKADEIDGEYNAEKAAPTMNDINSFKPMTYFNDGTRTIDEDIENIRKTHMKQMNSTKVFDIVSLVLMLIAFAGVLLVTFLVKDESMAWVTWVVLGVAIAVILTCFILSTVFNKKRTKATQDYLTAYEDASNGYAISSLGVENPMLYTQGTVDNEKVIQAHYFSTINSIGSRAIIEAKRKDKDLSIAEIAVQIPAISYVSANAKPADLFDFDGKPYVKDISSSTTETVTGTTEIPTKDMTLLDLDLAGEASGMEDTQIRRNDEIKAKKSRANEPTETTSGLFGKFVSYDMKVSSQESFIVAFMGDRKNTVLPDYVKGFQAIHVPGLRSNIVVYAADIRYSKVFFDVNGVKLLNGLVTGTTIQSAFLSVNSYGTHLGITLSDNIMQLPLKPLRSLGVFDSYKECMDAAFAFIDYVDDVKIKTEA